MEENAPYIEDQERLPDLHTHEESTNSSVGCETQDVWSESYLDEIIEYIPTANTSVCSSSYQPDNISNDICQKCIQLNLELQKSKCVIAKLQKRCTVKSAEIKRLRAAEKRSKFAKQSLEEILREIKAKKWISDEGQDVLNVIQRLVI